jgi:O-antigen/teichoic acid export membrane protein
MTHEMDTLLVSTFAGAGAAGLYYLSRRVARVAQTAGDMIQTVIYPDLARLWAQIGGAALRRMVTLLQLALAAMALSAIVACWLIGKPALDLAFGPGFAEGYPMLLVQLVAVMLTLHSAPARSALLAMNLPSHVLAGSIVSMVCFFVAAFALVPAYGGIGANIAHVIGGLVIVAMTDLVFWRALGGKAEPGRISEAKT